MCEYLKSGGANVRNAHLGSVVVDQVAIDDSEVRMRARSNVLRQCAFVGAKSSGTGCKRVWYWLGD